MELIYVMNINKGVAIIDYKLNNIKSVYNALTFLNIPCFITNDPEDISNASGLIFPGVGAFPQAIKQLEKLKLIESIEKFIISDKPFLAICLGFQLLFSESCEFNKTKGLDILKGRVLSLEDNKEINSPQFGWNKVHINNKFKNLDNNILDEKYNFYFVHSFYVEPDDTNLIFTYTQYKNFKFCSSVKYKNILGTQFHPEKSGIQGLNLLNNYFNKKI